MPLVSPLACFEASMLKGRAARDAEVRREVVAVRRVRVRKVDIVIEFVVQLGLLGVAGVVGLFSDDVVIW